MLSTKAVPDDVPARPAPNVAHASTIRPRRRLSGRPSGSVSPAALATPMNVDSESNRSVNRIATMAGSSDQRSASMTSSLRKTDEKSGALVELRRRRGEAEEPRERRRGEDRGQKRERVVAPQQDDGDDDSEQQESGAMIERAEAHEGRRIGGDQAGVAESDERQQQPDAAGRGDAKPGRNGHRHVFAQRRGRDEQEQHAGPEHHARAPSATAHGSAE